MSHDDALRAQVVKFLDWKDAHADFNATLADLPPALRGTAPAGLPYSPWQLLEHIRFTQADILAFCERADYHEPHWPDDYWPKTTAPPDPDAWDRSIASFHRDRKKLQDMAADPACDLFALVPTGTGPQTFLREFLVVVDHNAYHLGQILVVRRLLNSWPPSQ